MGSTEDGTGRAARRRMLALALGTVLAVLAAAAAHDSARLLLLVDEPIQNLVEKNRIAGVTRAFTALTALGHQNMILPASAAFVALSWRRCRIAAIAMLGVTGGRILLHLGLKDSIARDRPDLEPLVSAVGNSFPSGHVMSATIVWGMLPLAAGLLTSRRWIWWVAVAASVTIMATSTVSRFYLGVHWFTDSVAGLVSGWLFLLAIDAAIRRHHTDRPVLPGRAGELIARWAGDPRYGMAGAPRDTPPTSRSASTQAEAGRV